MKWQNEWADSRALHSYFPTGSELHLMSPALTWLSVPHSPASPMKYEASWTRNHSANTVYTLTVHIQTGAWEITVKVYACMHVCNCSHACVWVCDICLCVRLCICVPSWSSAEETRPLINSDEWLKIVSPTPLSLSESFYLTLQGILPCDVVSVLLS